MKLQQPESDLNFQIMQISTCTNSECKNQLSGKNQQSQPQNENIRMQTSEDNAANMRIHTYQTYGRVMAQSSIQSDGKNSEADMVIANQIQ